MAKRKKKKKGVSAEVVVAVLIIISLLLGVLIFLKSGYIGEHLSPMLGGLIGFMKYIIPFATLAMAIAIAYENGKYMSKKLTQYAGFILCICVILCMIQIFADRLDENSDWQTFVENAYTLGTTNQGGGAIGAMVAWPLIQLLGEIGTIILNAAVAVVLLAFMMGIKPTEIVVNMSESFKDHVQARREDDEDEEEEIEEDTKKKETTSKKKGKHKKVPENSEENLENQITIQMPEYADEKTTKGKSAKAKKLQKESPEVADSGDGHLFKQEVEQKEEKTKQVLTLEHGKTTEDEHYEFPPLDLLEKGKRTSSQRDDKRSVAETANRLQKTLYSFGVSAKVEKVSVGPAITRYELRPSEGVRVSKIAKLADDIALNLAAESIRIEAPIPGKQAVGIEVPNRENEMVHLRDIIDSNEFRESKSKLTMALGKNVAGDIVITDIAKMPHVLIAGSTGSGKSVCINTLITSILYKAKPSEVKLVMIDPKVVELSVYNGIPHLLIPVVTDPKKAAGALAWAVQEMVKRYSLFAQKGVRDIKGYNAELEKEEESEKLPQIVIIIDELADLMMVAPNEVEDAICRLAQMARAAGMHLVIATQRPSVDVITGIIKANIPSRIAFAVSSGVDSRTIIDMTGAEKLLGKGDMLFAPIGIAKPVRVQGAFVSDKEVESIVQCIKNQDNQPDYREDIIQEIENNTKNEKEIEADSDDETDPLLMDVIETVMGLGQASTSFIQRRFKVGYARAGRIIDQMEKMGIISGYEGSKPRQVIMPKERWEELKMAKTPAHTEENS